MAYSYFVRKSLPKTLSLQSTKTNKIVSFKNWIENALFILENEKKWAFFKAALAQIVRVWILSKNTFKKRVHFPPCYSFKLFLPVGNNPFLVVFIEYFFFRFKLSFLTQKILSPGVTGIFSSGRNFQTRFSHLSSLQWRIMDSPPNPRMRSSLHTSLRFSFSK